MEKTKKVVFETVMADAKGKKKFDIPVGGKDMDGLSLTAYPQGGYVRFSKSLYKFMKKPKYIRIYGNGDILSLVIVPEKKESAITWPLRQQTCSDGRIYDKGACIYNSSLAKLLGGYTADGGKVTLGVGSGSTPEHIIVSFQSSFENEPD